MCKSSAGPGRNYTIWKLSVFASCQPATRYPPWKTSPPEPQWLPVSQTAHRWPLQARKLSIQGAKGPRGPCPPPPGLWSGKERQRDLENEGGGSSLHFNLIASSLHFAPRLNPLFSLDLFVKKIWQGFPQHIRSADATSHAADSHVSWQLTLNQSWDQLHFACFVVFSSFFSNLFIYFILRRGCERLRQRHTALSVVVAYLSSPAFVSPLIATKYDQLAPSPCPWALWGIVKTFFRLGRIRTIEPQYGGQRERKTGTRDRTRYDSGGIVGLKFQLHTAVVSRGSEGFPGWRCPNGSVLIWIHRQPISACH